VREPAFTGIERTLELAQTGLSWWFGSAAVLYFGIGIALMSGKPAAAMAVFSEVQQVVDLFGLMPPKISSAKQLWWLIGLPWSLVAGSAVWGLAGTLGAFDPGRARAARFAGILFGGALLIWSAMIYTHMRQVEAAEERAAGIQR
jgi:hypothetical protein